MLQMNMYFMVSFKPSLRYGVFYFSKWWPSAILEPIHKECQVINIVLQNLI